MTQSSAASGDGGGGATPEVKPGRKLSIVWLIPVIAGAVGIWLAYTTLSQRGPTIHITFETADHLEAGKTQLKYRGVQIGSVTEIELTPDGVVVTAEVKPEAGDHARANTKHWVVKPRLGLGGVSGLGTLISGSYIEVLPGDGEITHNFVGLEKPPPGDQHGGLTLTLTTDRLGSLQERSPIYFRELQVGTITTHSLSKDGVTLTLHAVVRAPYHELVRDHSVFYRWSGIEVTGGITGVTIDAAPMQALLSGGVAFETPGGASAGKAVERGASFALLESPSALAKASARQGLHVVIESPEAGSVVEGDEVFYREVAVGSVSRVEMSLDSRTIRTHLSIHWPYATLVRSRSVFWNASGISADLGLKGLHLETESLESLFAGGVAFATPDPPGSPVKAGSVFKLHGRSKDEWHRWSPVLWRGKHDQAPAAAPEPETESAAKKVEHKVAHFFHHDGKSEEATQKEHAEHHEHHLFGHLFHRGKDEDESD